VGARAIAWAGRCSPAPVSASASVVELGVGLSDLGRYLLVGLQARGVKAGYYTGWLNLIGPLGHCRLSGLRLCHLLRSHPRISRSRQLYLGQLDRIFLYFLAILVIAAVVNIFSSHLLGIFNNISVWWHVIGAGAIVAILIFLPHHHRQRQIGFHHDSEQHRILRGEDPRVGFIFIVLPSAPY